MWQGGIHITLFAICCIVSGTAIPGGVALMAGWGKDRYGEALLIRSPYKSFVIPGLALALSVGGSAAWAALVTWYNPELGGLVAMIGGCIVMAWIFGEIYIIRRPLGLGTLVELLYFLCGLAMLLLGLMLHQKG